MDRAKRKFCLDRNLTDTGWYDKQDIGWLHQWYDAIAYTPQTNGVVYDLTHEAPEMFSFDDDDDVPQDRVWHDPDIDQLDLAIYDNAIGTSVVNVEDIWPMPDHSDNFTPDPDDTPDGELNGP